MHCLHCEEEKVESPKLFCPLCEEWIYRVPLSECFPKQAVSLEKEGAALSLFKQRNGPLSSEILSTLAAFMALQVFDLKWPSFDFIIPWPGEVSNVELVKKLSAYLSAPLSDSLKSEDEWKGSECFSGKVILVVDLTLSFSHSLEILDEAVPLEVYYLGCFRK